MNIKNVVLASSSDNKIISTTIGTILINELDKEVILSNIKPELQMLLSDNLVVDRKYIFTFDIKSVTDNTDTDILISINDGESISKNIPVNNNWQKCQIPIYFNSPKRKIHNRLRMEVPNLNFLKLKTLDSKIINIKNFTLIEENQSVKNDNPIEVFTIYHYQPFNLTNDNTSTYNQQAQKIRFLLLRNIDKFINKIVCIYSIDEHDIPPIIGDNNMFYCDDIHNKIYADKIEKFCSLISKNRYYFGYESPNHRRHYWKIDTNFLDNNFDHIYSSSQLFTTQYHWVPAYHTYFFESEFGNCEIKHISCEKKKFMTNNPFSGSNPLTRDKIIMDIGSKCNFEFYGTEPKFIDYFTPLLASENDYLSEGNLSIRKSYVFSHYKYILVCENCSLDGYVSEKLIDSLTCGSIPIYFGPHDAEKYFPELFENGVINGFKCTTDELITLLINMSDDEYKTRVLNIQKNTQSLFLACSEYAQLNYIFSDFFSQYNINLDISRGTEYLKDINTRNSNNNN